MTAKIDLHIHSKDGSDGNKTLEDIFLEAHQRHIRVISITDHDSIDCQDAAAALAAQYGIYYVSGVELNISFSHPLYRDARPVSLDVLGYQYDIHNQKLREKLHAVREYRKARAEKILEKINAELTEQGLDPFTHRDWEAIKKTADGALGRPHIADYLIAKGIVSTKQEAFDRYLVKCNVPKMPVSLEEASQLIHGAGGKLVLAHPNDPNGTSLVSLTTCLKAQHEIIWERMLGHIDGVECWHSRHDSKTVSSYRDFAHQEGLMVTGGSDCHQQPIIMGTVPVPVWVAEQFGWEP